MFIANLYRQDFLWLGYNAQMSFHANWDDPSVKYDRNGFLVRPDPIGAARRHEIDAYYFGWAGEGHIGEAAFVELLAHPATDGVPFILETPDSRTADNRDIPLLKRLRG